MATKKKQRGAAKSVAAVVKHEAETIDALERRVAALEADFLGLKADMVNLGADLASLQRTVRQVDERTIRGERVMLEVQGEQRHMMKVIDRIAHVLDVAKEPGSKEST